MFKTVLGVLPGPFHKVDCFMNPLADPKLDLGKENIFYFMKKVNS